MASPNGATPTRRSAEGHEIVLKEEASPAPPEDFEFCVLPSGGLALAAEDCAGMCAADEVFSGGKLLPLRLSSANLGDASSPAPLLLRYDWASTCGLSSRSTSRSASSSSSSSCVSRSTSSKSASSDLAYLVGSLPNKTAAASFDTVEPQRSLSNSVFYAQPSPSPRPLPRRRLAAGARRSTGSAPPPAALGVIRLGVVGAPEVYTRRRTTAESTRKVAARAGGSQSARFELPKSLGGTREEVRVDRKLELGILGAGLVCSCSPDAVAPVGTEEVAAKARQRTSRAEGKKNAAVKQSPQSNSRRSKILDWLDEMSSMPSVTSRLLEAGSVYIRQLSRT